MFCWSSHVTRGSLFVAKSLQRQRRPTVSFDRVCSCAPCRRSLEGFLRVRSTFHARTRRSSFDGHVPIRVLDRESALRTRAAWLQTPVSHVSVCDQSTSRCVGCTSAAALRARSLPSQDVMQRCAWGRRMRLDVRFVLGMDRRSAREDVTMDAWYAPVEPNASRVRWNARSTWCRRRQGRRVVLPSDELRRLVRICDANTRPCRRRCARLPPRSRCNVASVLSFPHKRGRSLPLQRLGFASDRLAVATRTLSPPFPSNRETSPRCNASSVSSVATFPLSCHPSGSLPVATCPTSHPLQRSIMRTISPRPSRCNVWLPLPVATFPSPQSVSRTLPVATSGRDGRELNRPTETCGWVGRGVEGDRHVD